MTHRPLDNLEIQELIAGPLAARLQAPRSPGEDLHTMVHAHHGGTPTFGELDVSVEGLTARLFDSGGRAVAEVRWPSPSGAATGTWLASGVDMSPLRESRESTR